MFKSIELKEQRSSKFDEISKILSKAETEKRGLEDEERSLVEALKREIENINTDIETAELLEKEEKRKAESTAEKRKKQPKKSEEEKILERHSILRGVRMIAEGRGLDGVEKEMHEEAIREARASGAEVSGQLAIPSWVARGREQRDMVAGTATAGGNTIQTDVGRFIDILEPTLQAVQLGANVLTGLTGNILFPRGNADATATWVGENAGNSETSPTTDSISFSPNRLGAFTDLSKQLLVQSSIDVENWVRRRLNFAVNKALDAAAINGSGTSNQPTGILNTTGIGDVAGGANGAAPTFGNLIDLETEVAVGNADMGALAYLTTPGIRGKLKQTLLDSGSGQFVWAQGSNELNGYRAAVSTQVPSTLTKGSSSGVAHAIIFGNWNHLMIGQWAGLDIVVDPYTRAKEAMVVLVVNSWWDIAVEHPESFAAMKDALLS